MRFLFVVFALLWTLPLSAAEMKRVALVIGIENYSSLTRLNNPVRDADGIAAVLNAHGFRVFLHKDLDYSNFMNAVDKFVEASKGAGEAVIFYSGHGMGVSEEGRIVNALAATDASLDCRTRRAQKVIALEQILVRLDHIPKKVALFDACRNDPLPQCRGFGFQAPQLIGANEGAQILSVPAKQGPGRGIGVAPVDRQSKLLIGYSSNLGETASDGQPGGHSPYTDALLGEFGDNAKLPFRELLERTAVRVTERTGSQFPWVVTKGGEPDMCLAGKACEYREVLNCARSQARARQLAARAEDEINSGQPVDGVLLALEAMPDEVTKRCGWMAEPLSAVIRGQRFIRELHTASTPYDAASGPYNIRSEAGPKLLKLAELASDAPAADAQATVELETWKTETRSSTGLLARRARPEEKGNGGAGTKGAHVIISDAKTGAKVSTMQIGPDETTEALFAFSNDGQKLVSCGSDGGLSQGSVDTWDVASGRKITTLLPGVETCSSFSFYPKTGIALASAQPRGSSTLLDVERGLKIAELKTGYSKEQTWVSGAKIAKDGRFFLTVENGNGGFSTRLWDARRAAERETFFSGDGWQVGADLSPSGNEVVSASSSGNVYVWSRHTGEVTKSIAAHEGRVSRVRYSPSGTAFVTVSFDDQASVKLWNAQTGKLIHLFPTSSNAVDANFSPGGDKLVVAETGGAVVVFDVQSARREVVLKGHTAQTSQAIYVSGGERIVSSSNDGTVRIWDAKSKKQPVIIRHDEAHRSPEISASKQGNKLLIASDTGAIQLVDIPTGQVIGAKQALPGGSAAASLTPDGNFVISASANGELIMWDIGKSEVFAMLKGHTTRVQGLRFDQTGDFLMSASDDGTIRIWRVRSAIEDYVLAARRSVSRCFTKVQRDYYGLPSEQPEWCAAKWHDGPTSRTNARR